MTQSSSPHSVSDHSRDHEGDPSGSNVATCDDVIVVVVVQDVVTLMKQRLPEYIVNCFMSSGYDEMEVISTMDISDKEHNSIDNIEKFIQRKYVNRAECNPFPSPTFEFSPGHRIRICNFVKEVKKLRESCESDKNVRTRKRGKPISHVHPKSNVFAEKRQKHLEDSEEDPSDVQESNVLSVMGVSKQVRSSLRKWMAKQNDRLRQLHEGEDYSLQIMPKSTPGTIVVSIRCLACGTSVMLHQVKSSVMVSNWYRHAKLCFRQQADKKLIQLPIHGYIGGPQRENNSGIATDSNNCSRKDSDAGSDTTIHGPIVDLAGFNKSSLNENKDVPNSQQLQTSTLSNNQVF